MTCFSGLHWYCKYANRFHCSGDKVFYNLTEQTNVESNYVEVGEFDPIQHHHHFCPWINGNVAAARHNSGMGTSTDALALCGWQLTLDALDALQSLDHVPIQTVESESAASLYKVWLTSFYLFLLSSSKFIWWTLSLIGFMQE